MTAHPEGISRRSALGILGGLAAASAVAGAVSARGASASVSATGVPADDVVPFRGAHQAGITTAAQDRLHMVALDVITESREELVALLAAWTEASDRMTRGLDAGPVGAVGGLPEAPPDDTGEAIGLSPARLTLTFGVGPTLFTDAEGRDRFGLADRRPAALADLPEFAGDDLDPARSGGDLCIQACSDDPQVAVHAVRNLARIGFGTVRVRWSQLGFGRTSSTSTAQTTPRNLMGFKDGTSNIDAEDAAGLADHVWVQPGDGADWMVGGSYLVARRVAITVETWDRVGLAQQEAVFGRDKREGAPLTGTREHDVPDFAAVGADGEPVMPATSHVRLAHPTQNGGARMLRRGYSYVDGTDGLGRLDAGLFFLAYMRDPRTSFVPVQQHLSRSDALNEYIRHTASAIFAVPPGPAADDHWAAALVS